MFSVFQVLKKVGANASITNKKDEIYGADAIILPGVGSFGNAMQNLNKLELASVITDYAESGRPVLGICLGMQLLFEMSNEFGLNEGLKLIKGDVVKFSDLHAGTTIPHTQWNRVCVNSKKSVLFDGINDNPFMYFIHSYYAKPSNPDLNIFNANYGGIEYCCAIETENIFGVQFHPERSSLDGIRLINNFVKII